MSGEQTLSGLLNELLVMKVVQKLARAFRARQIVSDQLLQAIFAQMREVVQILSSACIQNQQAFHVTCFVESALPLFDRYVTLHATR